MVGLSGGRLPFLYRPRLFESKRQALEGTDRAGDLATSRLLTGMSCFAQERAG